MLGVANRGNGHQDRTDAGEQDVWVHLNHATVGRAIQLSKDLWVITTQFSIDRFQGVAYNPAIFFNASLQFIIAALRAANALTASLVAELAGHVVGHITFSPVTMSDGSPGWYGLGPVSVLPAYQQQGIGGALIQEGQSRLKGLGARGCCLVGHPAYYQRFGFQNTRGLGHEGVPEDVFFVMSFDGRITQGSVEFHEGFKAAG